MTLSWSELASHGLMKKIPEKELVALVMRYLRPMRRKWVKDHGKGEVEKYIMENGHHGSRKLYKSPYISKEMWCKAALRKEFKAQWWWRAPEKRRERCYEEVLSRNNYSGWEPRPIFSMHDDYLKNDVHGFYETLDRGGIAARRWDDKWSRKEDRKKTLRTGSWQGTHAILHAKWYQKIHEGRYFLFFKMNERLKEKEKTSPGYIANHFYPKLVSGQRNYKMGTVAYDVVGFCPTEQCASDFLTIDGYGLNHSPGKEVMHIDDMFC